MIGLAIEVIATLASDTNGVLATEQRMTLHLNLGTPGVTFELENLWRVLRDLGSIKGWIPTLCIRCDGSRSVSLRVPPFAASELPDRERATTVLEALRKIAQP